MIRKEFIFALVLFSGLMGLQSYSWLNTEPMVKESQATGGAGQIAEKIIVYLKDAQTYLNEGDNSAAQEEIDKAIKELMDTYEADQQEH